MTAASRKLAVALTILTLTLITNIPLLVPASSAQATGDIQNGFLALVNAERASLDKTPLAANSQLESAAYLHSKDMGDNYYFSHTSHDGTQFSQRITNAGYKYVAAAENIAYAYRAPDAAKVYDMWKNSLGHYANMIGDYFDAGLGFYSINGYTYYTLDLGRSQNPSTTPRPTASPTPTPSPTATPNPTPTPTFTPTATPTATPLPTPKPPTPTPTNSPAHSPSPTATPAPTLTPAPKPTVTPTPNPTTSPASPTPTPTATPSPTATPPPSNSTSPLPSTSPPSASSISHASATPTSTPTIPELPLLILLPMIVLVLSIAVAIKLKNR